ncbi:MAG: hypothetical protein RR450_07125 [Oscillospiraceae bacterium]
MFKKLGTLILTGALCAALILPALAAEMTLSLGKNGEKVILSDVVSTEKKTVPFCLTIEPPLITRLEKELTIYHLAPGCIATFHSCENGYMKIYEAEQTSGEYWEKFWAITALRPKLILESNRGELVELLGHGDNEEGIFCMPATHIATAAPQTVLVNGKEVKFDAYALKDENGNMTNYFKVRDIASVLNGTAAQFSVDWKDHVVLKTKMAYTPSGSEMTTPFTGNQPYVSGFDAIAIDDYFSQLDYLTLTDAKGGGYTYYKLRDLGEHLGFKVDWNGKNVTIATAP